MEVNKKGIVKMFKNFFKATLRKLADISAEDFFNLLQWGDSTIKTSNPHLLVASATDENGAVAYTTIEPTWIISGYAFRPKLTDGDAGHAGDSMYSIIEREAKVKGVGKVLIVLPDEVPTQLDEQFLRVIELKLPQKLSATHHDSQRGCYEHPVTLPN